MNNIKSRARYIVIDKEAQNQRVDNFLINYLKGVPRSHIYRIIRKGEIRVNKGRVSAFYRLKVNDSIRIPPIFLEEQAKAVPPSKQTVQLLADRILYEDEILIILNKPSGMSVHGGSTVRVGIIEALRQMFPKLKNLELAHRLDSETSGCLILAKRKSILREVHSLLREGKVTKKYLALTKGVWKESELRVDQALHKNFKEGGKHVVSVSQQGKTSLTVFRTKETFKFASLMEAKLFTGRTHQIRVHAEHQGHPIAGDDRYGDTEFNKEMKRFGLKRMFLHAHSIEFTLPSLNRHIKVTAPLDPELASCINQLKK